MNRHSFVFRSFYGLTVSLFPLQRRIRLVGNCVGCVGRRYRIGFAKGERPSESRFLFDRAYRHWISPGWWPCHQIGLPFMLITFSSSLAKPTVRQRTQLGTISVAPAPADLGGRSVVRNQCTPAARHGGLYATREEIKAGVIDSIEMFYNSQRQHSYLGYTNPMEFEAKANAA